MRSALQFTLPDLSALCIDKVDEPVEQETIAEILNIGKKEPEDLRKSQAHIFMDKKLEEEADFKNVCNSDDLQKFASNFIRKHLEKKKQNELKKSTHQGYTCVVCGKGPIIGIRYQCSTRPEFNLCEGCEATAEVEFPLIKIRCPTKMPESIICSYHEDKGPIEMVPAAHVESDDEIQKAIEESYISAKPVEKPQVKESQFKGSSLLEDEDDLYDLKEGKQEV